MKSIQNAMIGCKSQENMRISNKVVIAKAWVAALINNIPVLYYILHVML
jgi:hypothetical protein